MSTSNDNDAPASGRKPWVPAIVLLTLAAGVLVWVAQSRPPREAPPAASGSLEAPADTSEAVLDQALGQIPTDSTELKNRWLDEVKGVDVARLSAPQLALFVRFANAERCTCGCGFTLATCRAFDATCPVSLPRTERLRDSIASGLITSAAGLRARP